MPEFNPVFANDSIRVYSPNLHKAGGMWFLFHHLASNQLLMIDCGVGFAPEITFDTEFHLYNSEAEQQLIFIKQLMNQTGNSNLDILITHPHLDHSNGIPLVAKIADIHVFASWFSLHCQEQQMRKNKIEINFAKTTLKEEKGIFNLGIFKISYFKVSHSVPQSYSFILEFPDSKDKTQKILFLTEMRLADLPCEPGTTEKALEIIKFNSPYDLVFYDGMLSRFPGESTGEESLRPIVAQLFRHKLIKGDIIFPCISSKVGITQIILEEANRANWAFLPYGAMLNFILAVAWQAMWLPPKEFPEGISYQIAKVVSGSQAEQDSVLDRIDQEIEDSRQIKLEIKENDWLVFLQGIIPGNNAKVTKMIEKLAKKCPRGGILLTRGQKASLKLDLPNVYVLEDFLGLKEDILLPSGHERKGGIERILAYTNTPEDRQIVYQDIKRKKKFPKEIKPIEEEFEEIEEIIVEPVNLDKFQNIVDKVLLELTKNLNL